jgi:hypothetical protein
MPSTFARAVAAFHPMDPNVAHVYDVANLSRAKVLRIPSMPVADGLAGLKFGFPVTIP